MESYKKESIFRKILLPLFFSLIVIGILLWSIRMMAGVNDQKAIESIENAIVQASVHCYAVEGMYPESLDYLKEHYGITYDEKKYVVKYEVIAQNIRPLIHVIDIDKQE